MFWLWRRVGYVLFWRVLIFVVGTNSMINLYWDFFRLDQNWPALRCGWWYLILVVRCVKVAEVCDCFKGNFDVHIGVVVLVTRLEEGALVLRVRNFDGVLLRCWAVNLEICLCILLVPSLISDSTCFNTILWCIRLCLRCHIVQIQPQGYVLIRGLAHRVSTTANQKSLAGLPGWWTRAIPEI